MKAQELRAAVSAIDKLEKLKLMLKAMVDDPQRRSLKLDVSGTTLTVSDDEARSVLRLLVEANEGRVRNLGVEL